MVKQYQNRPSCVLDLISFLRTRDRRERSFNLVHNIVEVREKERTLINERPAFKDNQISSTTYKLLIDVAHSAAEKVIKKYQQYMTQNNIAEVHDNNEQLVNFILNDSEVFCEDFWSEFHVLKPVRLLLYYIIL